MKRLRHKAWFDYSSQQRSARSRGIPFELTFVEWIQIWEDSGRISERGKMGHQYCMARFGDKGGYTVGNVKVITNRENLTEETISNRPSWHKRVKKALRRREHVLGLRTLPIAKPHPTPLNAPL